MYIPLGGNRRGAARTYTNLMLTMLIGGLWHGAAWTFVVWGFLHGSYLIIERLVRLRFPIKPSQGPIQIILAFLTFSAVNITWVFFRAPDFQTAWRLLLSLFYVEGEKAVLQTNFMVLTRGLMALVFLGHFAMRKRSLIELIDHSPRWLIIFTWGLMLFAIATVQSSGEQFIYFQF